MTWLLKMDILKIYLEEQLLVKYCVIKHLILLEIQNMLDINVGLIQWFINFLIKRPQVEQKNIPNKELAEGLHKPIIKKFQKGKVHSTFIDNIWGTDLADMQLISKLNKVIRFLLCAIDDYT